MQDKLDDIAHLDIKENGGLGDDCRLFGLLLMISLQPLLGDSLLLLTLFLIRASKEVNIVVLLLSRGRCSLGWCRCSLGSGFATLKLTNASLQRKDKRLQVISD